MIINFVFKTDDNAIEEVLCGLERFKTRCF
jgi:hypothetical protein